MPEATTYLWFGSMISAVGIGLVMLHIRSHRQHRADGDLNASDLRFYEQQYSRRMQTSALLITLGALIGLCGYLKVFEDSPVFATCYVIGLLLLALWLILLALSDAVATRVYSSRLDRRNRDMQKSLQDALAEVRKAHGLDSN
ncbi:MAG: hypothetical protein NXI04_13995 [Planctomycetaceae bacterium]|nr:hypothetical protein [Planctomycetaceae bacterium]